MSTVQRYRVVEYPCVQCGLNSEASIEPHILGGYVKEHDYLELEAKLARLNEFLNRHWSEYAPKIDSPLPLTDELERIFSDTRPALAVVKGFTARDNSGQSDEYGNELKLPVYSGQNHAGVRRPVTVVVLADNDGEETP